MKQELPPESEDAITAPGAPDLMCRPLDGEDESAVTGYAQAFLAEHAPAAVTNGFLVEILASTAWRRRRFERMECGFFNDCRDDRIEENDLEALRDPGKLDPAEREKLETFALARTWLEYGQEIGRLVQIEDTCERAFLRSLRHLRDVKRPGKKSAQAE